MMRRILAETPVRQLVADIIGMVALVIALAGFTIVASGLVPQ